MIYLFSGLLSFRMSRVGAAGARARERDILIPPGNVLINWGCSLRCHAKYTRGEGKSNIRRSARLSVEIGTARSRKCSM